MADDEAHPAGRFEWERVVRRIIMPGSHKLIALVLASYADPDGSRVRPGDEVLADVTGQSTRNVRRITTALRGLGLLAVATRGGGRGGKGRASEYQLTIPADLLERVDMLAPGDRHTTDASTTAPSPVDNSDSPDTQVSAQSDQDSENDRTSGATSGPIDRTFSANDRTPGCPTTTHTYQPPGPHQRVTTQRESRPRATPERRRPPAPPSDARTAELEAA